jgi:serine/threonine protein kinase
MSPEHALSQPLDGRSDLYSLGVVAYQSLFGKLPFDADDPLEIISKHIHEPLVAPPLRTEDERQLYAVISRMLAKRPEDRFQSAMDVIISLGGQVLSHAPVSVAAITAPVFTICPTAPEPVVLKLRPDPPPADAVATLTLPPFPTPKFARPRRLWLAALGVAGVVIAAAAFALTRDDSPVPATVESSRQSPVAEARRDTSAPKVVSAKAERASEIRPAVVNTPPPAPPAKPKPSARAAAILAYNKLKSNCAKRDTMPDAAPIEYAVLLEPLSDRPRADQMSVTYDVCGLPAGTSFTANFTLTKLRQRGFRQQKPHVETALEKAGSPRSRESRRLDTREMSAGPYRLDIVVTDANQKAVTVTREFTITDK